MKYLLAILIFVFGFMVVYQIALGFPIISKIRDKRREKRWAAMLKEKKENAQKIKLLNRSLKGKDEIAIYIALNKYNLPVEDEWQLLLPKMIEDLLAIGWTTEMPIDTNYKYGRYEIHIYNCSKVIREKSRPIIYKYLDYYVDLD